MIALIPVDQDAARPLKGWHMPERQLYPALMAKTRGRVLRSDRDCDLLQTDATRPQGMTIEPWRRASARQCRPTFTLN